MSLWGGLSCCLSAGALYLLGRSSWKEAEILKQVPRVNDIWGLAQLLDSGIIPQIVTICGQVDSYTPISCEHSGLKAVMVDETAELHFLRHNDAKSKEEVEHNDSGSWIEDSALIQSRSKEVPWYLEDGTGCVYVVGARDATGFELTEGSAVFEQSETSDLDYVEGLKLIGVNRIERVLPIGTSLTVVGKVVKEENGAISIQRPYKGPFYVSPMTIDQLISDLGNQARWFKYASYGLTFGVYLITMHILEKCDACMEES